MENPFTLNYGKEPVILIDRSKEIDKIETVFEMNNPTYNSYIITGVRGSGKTVVLNLLIKQFNKKKDWITIDLANSKDMLNDLTYNLLHCEIVNNYNLKTEINLSLANIGISIKNENLFTNAGIVIENILKILKKKRKRVFIGIDEISSNEELKTFVSAYQKWLRQDADVFLVMTGTHENVDALINDKVLTFLGRTPKIEISSLDLSFIIDSYMKYLNINFENARKLSEETKGYAYAYQIVGYWAFKKHTSNFLEIMTEVDYTLLNGTYKKIWEDCKQNEKKILKALANDKTRTKDICDYSKIKINNFSHYKELLMKKKIIENVNYGEYEIILPRFKENILKGDLR